MERKPSTRFQQSAATRWLIPIIITILILGLLATLAIAFLMPAG
jgi:hypothetical protein